MIISFFLLYWIQHYSVELTSKAENVSRQVSDLSERSELW